MSSSQQYSQSIGALTQQQVKSSMDGQSNKLEQKSSSDVDVVSVVAKAKRAAISLWLVCHAKGCRFSGDECPHPGCSNTKRLLLHVKTCAARPGFDCPEKRHGCNQVRKLLAHYRRCREMRQRQSNGQSSRRPQYSCLVCSLMARHAINICKIDASRQSIKEQQQNTFQTPVRKGSGRAAGHFATGRRRSTSEGSDSERPPRSSSNMDMPPPPPRMRTNSLGSASSFSARPLLSLKPNQILPLPHNNANYNLSSDQTSPAFFYGTPPTTPQLMKRSVSSLSATAAPSPLDFGTAITNNEHQRNVEKDTNFHHKISLLRYEKLIREHHPNSKKEIQDNENKLDKINPTSVPIKTIRTDTSMTNSSSSPDLSGKTAAIICDDSNESEDSDSTKETSTHLMTQACIRQRSGSCSVLSSLPVNPGQCDTILEEKLDLENSGIRKEQKTNLYGGKKTRSCSFNLNEI